MAHFTEIAVEGLAGRSKIYEQKLNRDVNVFFGFNGSGKTSLLKIFDAAMSNDPSIVENVPFTHAEVKFFSVDQDKVYTRVIKRLKATSRKTSKTLPTSIDSELSGHRDRRARKVSIVTKPKIPVDYPNRFRHEYLPTSRLYLDEESDDESYVSEEILDAHFAASLERLWTSYSAEILSNVTQAQRFGLTSILKAVLATTKQKKPPAKVNPEVAFKRLSSFLERQGSRKILGSLGGFEKRYLADATLRSVVGDINEVEQRIEKAMLPRHQLQELIQDMVGDTKVRFRDQSIDILAPDKTRIGLPSLSSGQKHVLKIFIETLRVEFNSLLIDEPELSMHVDWQKRLVASMRQLNPSAQLILATHSPEIMADLADDKIFRL